MNEEGCWEVVQWIAVLVEEVCSFESSIPFKNRLPRGLFQFRWVDLKWVACESLSVLVFS